MLYRDVRLDDTSLTSYNLSFPISLVLDKLTVTVLKLVDPSVNFCVLVYCHIWKVMPTYFVNK